MKSKNPQAFWLRWLLVSSLHAIGFTSLWMNNGWLFTEWYSFPLLNIGSGIVLAALQYWAMPATMRPNAKRWFSASILSHILAVSIHTFVVQAAFPNPNPLSLWFVLFLLPTLAQAWALSEHFKKAWIFALASFLPASILFMRIPIQEIYQNYFLFEIFAHLLRAIAMGGSLAFLRAYQRKETESLAVAHECLAIQEEELIVTEESSSLTQQKIR